mmetsp:Transcript_24843/g.62356  ORF Transcript_24843/g.62356 Transcript_24843/m.62356 type:complete len:217 (-) Transcript_24843:330-980(-)
MRPMQPRVKTKRRKAAPVQGLWTVWRTSAMRLIARKQTRTRMLSRADLDTLVWRRAESPESWERAWERRNSEWRHPAPPKRTMRAARMSLQSAQRKRNQWFRCCFPTSSRWVLLWGSELGRVASAARRVPAFDSLLLGGPRLQTGAERGGCAFDSADAGALVPVGEKTLVCEEARRSAKRQTVAGGRKIQRRRGGRRNRGRTAKGASNSMETRGSL